MSNRIRLKPTRIPGGCDDCTAYQTIKTRDGVHYLTVHHDNTCPYLNHRTR